jgi:hypothetical protein
LWWRGGHPTTTNKHRGGSRSLTVGTRTYPAMDPLMHRCARCAEEKCVYVPCRAVCHSRTHRRKCPRLATQPDPSHAVRWFLGGCLLRRTEEDEVRENKKELLDNKATTKTKGRGVEVGQQEVVAPARVPDPSRPCVSGVGMLNTAGVGGIPLPTPLVPLSQLCCNSGGVRRGGLHVWHVWHITANACEP